MGLRAHAVDDPVFDLNATPTFDRPFFCALTRANMLLCFVWYSLLHSRGVDTHDPAIVVPLYVRIAPPRGISIRSLDLHILLHSTAVSSSLLLFFLVSFACVHRLALVSLTFLRASNPHLLTCPPNLAPSFRH